MSDSAKPTPASLELLLAGCAAGDRAAFTEIYERLAAPIYGIANRVLRNRALSEEIAQDVLLELWLHADRFDASKGSARTWIMTIAHRRAVDRVRAEQAAADRLRRVGGRVEPDYDVTAGSAELNLEREAVRRCLECLTALQRQAVTLAFYTGSTYDEVAKHLGIPPGTARTRIRDGLIRLRTCLGRGWGPD